MLRFLKTFCVILGPGQYAPEKTKLDKTPQYSFGLRPDISKPSDVPGKYLKKYIAKAIFLRKYF